MQSIRFEIYAQVFPLRPIHMYSRFKRFHFALQMEGNFQIMRQRKSSAEGTRMECNVNLSSLRDNFKPLCDSHASMGNQLSV